MKCDSDGCPNDATVHEVLIKGGKKIDKRLCDACAKKQGIVVQTHTPITELLTKFVLQQAAPAQPAAAAAAKGPACPGCGMTWAKFRQTGLLGCPECYTQFEKDLMPLIERAHEGAARHKGKAPRRVSDSADHSRLASLRKELEDAVASEQYERAAALRDQLRQIDPRRTDADEGASRA